MKETKSKSGTFLLMNYTILYISFSNSIPILLIPDTLYSESVNASTFTEISTTFPLSSSQIQRMYVSGGMCCIFCAYFWG